MSRRHRLIFAFLCAAACGYCLALYQPPATALAQTSFKLMLPFSFVVLLAGYLPTVFLSRPLLPGFFTVLVGSTAGQLAFFFSDGHVADKTFFLFLMCFFSVIHSAVGTGLGVVLRNIQLRAEGEHPVT